MRFIDVHDVGYGECVVFEGEQNKILMVDCGSMNTVLKHAGVKFKDYVTDFIIPRYRDVQEKNFLLTHFHRDHFCGFKYILKKEKNFFDKVYIPYPSRSAANRVPLLEMAIYAFVFLKRQQSCASMSTSALFIFEFLRKNSCKSKVYPQKKDDFFEFSGVTYKVLNPESDFFPFSRDFIQLLEQLDDLLKSSFDKDLVNDFFYFRKLFCDEYVNCCELCRICEDFSDERISKCIDEISYCAVELNELSKKLVCTDISYGILDVLNKESTGVLYSSAQNSASIVFQNAQSDVLSGGNILMTGDVTSEIFSLLENDLFSSYNVVKAPHHGTANYWSDVLQRVGSSHLIISNGEYHAGGKISSEYAKNSAIKHCLGSENCEYLRKNGSCCNRLLFCDSLGKSGELSSKCKENLMVTAKNRCGVYLISGGGARGCYCD